MKSIEKKGFNNQQIIIRMMESGLLTGSAEEWKLIFLTNESGKAGIYARKSNARPVAVPADLITLPAFGPSITTGSETNSPNGTIYIGTTEISSATISVDGIPAAGLSTNGIRTITATIEGVKYHLETVSSTMSFTGGKEGTGSAAILNGALIIGSAKVSALKALP